MSEAGPLQADGSDAPEDPLSNTTSVLNVGSDEYRQLLHNSSLAIVVGHPHSERIIEANQALADLLGYTREELLELEIRDVIHPDSRADSAADEKSLASGATSSVTNIGRFVRKDGSEVWARVHASSISRADEILIMVCVEDWTEAHWRDDRVLDVKP